MIIISYLPNFKVHFPNLSYLISLQQPELLIPSQEFSPFSASWATLSFLSYTIIPQVSSAISSLLQVWLGESVHSHNFSYHLHLSVLGRHSLLNLSSSLYLSTPCCRPYKFKITQNILGLLPQERFLFCIPSLLLAPSPTQTGKLSHPQQLPHSHSQQLVITQVNSVSKIAQMCPLPSIPLA